MAFDGITISSIVNELNDTINGGRLYKISQPEADEIMLTIKTQSGQYRLVLSANASLPLHILQTITSHPLLLHRISACFLENI